MTTDSFGRNDAQIRALFRELAAFEETDWQGLTLATTLMGTDPDAAEPHLREMIETQHLFVDLASETFELAREKAVETGVWPEIEASGTATSGSVLEIATEAAARFNPGASSEALAEAVKSYSSPVRGLTDVLRFRPYLNEGQFQQMWEPYEMFCGRLERIRKSLPPHELVDRPLLGAMPNSGGCLIPVAIAAVTVASQIM